MIAKRFISVLVIIAISAAVLTTATSLIRIAITHPDSNWRVISRVFKRSQKILAPQIAAQRLTIERAISEQSAKWSATTCASTTNWSGSSPCISDQTIRSSTLGSP